MVRFSRSILSTVAMAGALLASRAVMPAHADEPLNNLGPVGPHEPISSPPADNGCSPSTNPSAADAP